MSDHGDGGEHHAADYHHHDSGHDSWYDDHTIHDGEDGYYDNDDKRKKPFNPFSPERSPQSRKDTIRKVALAVGLAGVVGGAIYYWNKKKGSERDQQDYDRRRRRRQKRDFARAKEARRRKEQEEDDDDEDDDSLDDHFGRGREPRKITYAPMDPSRSRSRMKKDRRGLEDSRRDDRDNTSAVGSRTRARDYGYERQSR